MKKLIIAALLLLLLITGTIFFSLNFLVKKAVNALGPKIMKVEVCLGSANLSPFSGSGRLTHLLVGNPAGYKTPYAVLLGNIDLKTKTDSIFSNTILLDEIAIRNPEITLEGTPFGNNLVRILDNLKGSSKSAKNDESERSAGSTKSRKFIVKEIIIYGAKLHISVSTANQSFDQTLILPDIHIQNIGSSEGGVSAAELAQEILNPLINSAIRSGTGPLLKEGLKGLNIKGAEQINKALNSLFK